MSDYNTYLKESYKKDLEYCSQFLFSFGSNYAKATSFFSRSAREDTIVFYAFVRYADELVDNPEKKLPGQTHETLLDYIKEWKGVVENGPEKETHQIIRAAYWFFVKHEIPFDYSFDFFNVMEQDLTKERYETYKELVAYMWGSASVVGHVMTFILGYEKKEAFDHAQALAEAMQMANFLRDVDEDCQQRNRIYLPGQEMQLFDVSSEDIAKRKMTPELVNFVRFQVERTHELFYRGIKGIPLLSSGRFPVLFASIRYRQYLYLLEKRNYDIFGDTIKISSWRKKKVIAEAFVRFVLKRY